MALSSVLSRSPTRRCTRLLTLAVSWAAASAALSAPGLFASSFSSSFLFVSTKKSVECLDSTATRMCTSEPQVNRLSVGLLRCNLVQLGRVGGLGRCAESGCPAPLGLGSAQVLVEFGHVSGHMDPVPRHTTVFPPSTCSPTTPILTAISTRSRVSCDIRSIGDWPLSLSAFMRPPRCPASIACRPVWQCKVEWHR